MTASAAREALRGRLWFGDEQQVAAVRLLSRGDEAREIARTLYPGESRCACPACMVAGVSWGCDVCGDYRVISLPMSDEVAIAALPHLKDLLADRQRATGDGQQNG